MSESTPAGPGSSLSLLRPPTSTAPPGNESDKERKSNWLVRHFVNSVTGRVVVSGMESVSTAGTIVCLSPWGDSTALVLPNIRFRDLAMASVHVATGGTAFFIAPVAGGATDMALDAVSDHLFVQIVEAKAFDVAMGEANDAIVKQIWSPLIHDYNKILQTSSVKNLLITLKYMAIKSDATLGFFRSSLHSTPSLFSPITSYLAIRNGWFAPYLNASGRRPAIPRRVKADVVMCWGPFLQGDWEVAAVVRRESVGVVELCEPPPEAVDAVGEAAAEGGGQREGWKGKLGLDRLTEKFTSSTGKRKSESSTSPTLPAPEPSPVKVPRTSRRLLVTLMGLLPHRHLWQQSARPGESVLHYLLLSGSPALLLPVLPGSPVVSWCTLTLKDLQGLEEQGNRKEGVIGGLWEFVSCLVEWERVRDISLDTEKAEDGDKTEAKKELSVEEKYALVKKGLGMIVQSAVESRTSKAVKDEVDLERAGIVFFRMP